MLDEFTTFFGIIRLALVLALNSQPTVPCWRHVVSIGLGNGLLPDGTEPLSKPIMTYHWAPVKFTWGQCCSNLSKIIYTKLRLHYLSVTSELIYICALLVRCTHLLHFDRNIWWDTPCVHVWFILWLISREKDRNTCISFDTNQLLSSATWERYKVTKHLVQHAPGRVDGTSAPLKPGFLSAIRYINIMSTSPSTEVSLKDLLYRQGWDALGRIHKEFMSS